MRPAPPPTAKESARELPRRPALIHLHNPARASAGKVAQTREANLEEHALRVARRSANSNVYYVSYDSYASCAHVGCRGSVYHDFRRRVDLLAAEPSIGGGALRHRHGGGGEADGAAPPEPPTRHQHLRYSSQVHGAAH